MTRHMKRAGRDGSGSSRCAFQKPAEVRQGGKPEFGFVERRGE